MKLPHEEIMEKTFKFLPFNEFYTTISCRTCSSPVSNIGTYQNDTLDDERYAKYDMEEHLMEHHDKE
jgi:hypothetical protein